MRKLFFIFCITVSFGFSCSSDYSCPLGYKCVKAPYNSMGSCMKKVDKYGMQSYDYSRDTNFGVKLKGDCSFDVDCPIGFRCDSYYKTCVKN